MSVNPVGVGTGFQQQPDRRPLALRREHRPPQRRIAVAIHGIDRRTRGQENLDDRWRLGLSRKMERRPADGIGCLMGGAPGQQHFQAFNVPVDSRIVHCRPPQPIPICHAAILTHDLDQRDRGPEDPPVGRFPGRGGRVAHCDMGSADLELLVAVLVVWLLGRRARRLAAWAAVTETAGVVIGSLMKNAVERGQHPHGSLPGTRAPACPPPSPGHPAPPSPPGPVCPPGSPARSSSWSCFLRCTVPGARAWALAARRVIGVGCTRVALGVRSSRTSSTTT